MNLSNRLYLCLVVVAAALVVGCGKGPAAEAPLPVAFTHLYPVRQNNLWGFIDSSGALVVPPRYQGADFFSDGLALVKVGEQWGYLRLDTTFQIAPRFYSDNVQRFSGGLARVRFRDRFGYIDSTGATVVPANYLQGMPFSEGLACVQDPETLKWGFINRQGQWVLGPNYTHPTQVSGGLFPADKTVGVGYLDTTGAVKIAYQYDYGTEFNEGIAFVYTHERDVFTVIRTGRFIGPDGKTAIPGSYSLSTGYAQGFASAQKGTKWGYINRSGETVVPFEYDMAGRFDGPLAPVYLGYKKLVPPRSPYEALSDSAEVRLGYVNRQGKLVYSPSR